MYVHVLHDETIQGVFFAVSHAVDHYALVLVRVEVVLVRTGFPVNGESLQNINQCNGKWNNK